MAEMTEHQRNVARALEGNEGVWFHPFEDRIAVWYGDKIVELFDSQTWESLQRHFLPVATEACATVTLAGWGYSRKGRSR